MNNSSSTTIPISTRGSSLIGPSSSVAPSFGAQRSTSEPGFAMRGSDRGAQEQVARLTARLNASKVSDAEVKALHEERQQLLDKQLDGTITKRQLARLDYVRWSLDRIEDAKHGATLDELESQIAQFERLSNQLNQLRDDLNRAATPRRR